MVQRIWFAVSSASAVPAWTERWGERGQRDALWLFLSHLGLALLQNKIREFSRLMKKYPTKADVDQARQNNTQPLYRCHIKAVPNCLKKDWENARC